MALSDDWSSTKLAWGKVSFPLKVFLGITFLANLLSGFSLLSHVTAFSGFIVEGYKFYRSATEPVREYANSWISLPRATFDLLLIAVTVQGAILRARSLSEHKDYAASFWSLSSLVLWLAAAGLNEVFSTSWLPHVETITFIFFIVCTIVTPLWSGWFPKEDRESPAWLIERLASGYILGILMLVGAVGAISKGLQQGLGIG